MISEAPCSRASALAGLLGLTLRPAASEASALADLAPPARKLPLLAPPPTPLLNQETPPGQGPAISSPAHPELRSGHNGMLQEGGGRVGF